MNYNLRLLAAILFAFACSANAATDWSTQDYDLYAGNFDSDGRTDLLYIAKNPAKLSGIATSGDSGAPGIDWQTWTSNYLGIPWSSGAYKAVVADFNGDSKSDVLMQRVTAGDSYLLLADPNGKLTSISQTIANSSFGLAWSADQHNLIAGDFSGDGKADLFFQATVPTGTHAIVLASSSGQFSSGPHQTWLDSTWSAFKWSTRNSAISAGDFNGDGKSDLLIRARASIVLIDYEIPIPVPIHAPNSSGVVYSQGGSTPLQQVGVQQWSRNANGVDWSANNSQAVIGDFNGDGRADVLLQSTNASRQSFLLNGNAGGSAFSAGAAITSNVALGTDGFRLIAGNFDGVGGAGLYFQSTSAGGSNYLANSISSSITAAVHTPSMSAPVEPAAAVGATKGAADVSSSGTGMYSIPLQLPAGTAGLTPTLALQYQHSGKNGTLGVGWGLSGFSIIARCPKKVALDGIAQGVQLLASDEYCLDGKRMRRVGSAGQGADGSEYRTELETYSLITAKGTGTNGPLWFEVKTKEGLIYHYGNSSDSRIPVTGTATTRVWAVSRIADRASNYISFVYTNDTANGSYRPYQIKYAGNVDQGTSPPFTVQFFDDARPSSDNVRYYYGGGVVRETRRFSRIEIQSGTTVLRKYLLGYESAGGLPAPSRLASVQECSATNCLLPTTFAWSNLQMSGAEVAVSSTTAHAIPESAFAFMFYAPNTLDLNGDGALDQFYIDGIVGQTPPGNLNVVWGAPHGQTGSSSSYGPAGFDYAPKIVLDWDNDGKDDLLFTKSGSPNTWWLHQRSNGTVGVDDTGQPDVNQVGATLADVDGDGYPDLVWKPAANQTQLFVRFKKRDGTAGFESTTSVAWTAPAGVTISPEFVGVPGHMYRQSLITAADINGDGMQEAIVHVSGGSRVLYANGTGFTTGETLPTTEVTFIDVNGDACTDLVWSAASPRTWRLAVSKCGISGGTGFEPEQDTGLSAAGNTVVATDYNLDGFQDLVIVAATTTVALSNGITLQAPTTSVSGYTKYSDWDGDGIPDKSDIVAGNYRAAVGPKPHLMTSAIDGFGNSATFSYAPLSDNTVYTRGAGGVGANQDFNGAMYVVKQLQLSNAIGGSYTLSQTYEQARRNVAGRGFLGFAKRTITDSRTGFVTQETYDQSITGTGTNWEFAGQLKTRKVLQSQSGPTVEEVTHTLASITPTGNSNARYPFVSQTQTKHFELGNTGSPFRTITRTTAIDGYGTPYDVSTVSVENATGVNAGSTHTQRSFTPTANITNDISANWCLNRRTRIQDIRSHSLTNGGQLTRTVDQTWDLPKCRMTDQVVEPGSSWALSTHLDYDAFNNVWKKTTSGSNVTSRTTETFWGADGRYPVWTKNALAHQTFYGWNYVRGLKETETDPNGNVTVTGYDDLGRTVRVRRPDGTATRQAFTACNAGNGFCGDGLLRFFVQVSERDVSDQIVNYKSTYYDAANRPKYDHTLSFDGAVTVVRTNYNARGNVETQSVPYFAGAGAFAQTTYTYDLLNRLKKQERPTDDQGASLHTELTDYNGLTTTRTNAASGVRTEVSTAWGVMAQVTDEALKHTVYTHNAFGELRTVTDPLSNTTSVNYNVRGFKQNSTDPDMGFWEFTYDALGQMLTQTDAKTQITAFTYDVLGRMSSRTDHGSQLTTWNWDTAANGKGQLGSVTAPGGYSETHTYDNRSRRSSVTTVAAGSSYTVDYGYDAALGQLSTITYPTATSGRFSVQYAYQNGFLKDVRDTSSPTTPLWRTITQNARGNVTQEGFGNGQITNLGFDAANGNLESLQTGPSGGTATQNLVYDWYKVGNLENRKDLNQSLTENFQYDSLHRLKEVRRNSALTLSMTYDDIGNIVTKSDVGSYTYHPTRKHAVTSAGGNAYAYDANGNMTSRSGATVTWTTYNYPQTINQAGGNFSTFHYGPDRSRYRQVSQNGTLAEDRIYIGGVFEKLTVGSKTEFRHYIKANGKIVAIKLLSTVSTDNETFYLHDDHLGSTDVITRQSGAVYQRLSYDAWGNRRGSAWTGTPSTADKNAINASTHIGFTGQEQLDNLNLVHLNGRVYDSVLARFMSADPLVQSPYVSQSFNRYSYTWNNPLNATDPSGFCTGFLLKSFCEMYHPEQVTSALVLVNGIETMIVGPRDGMTGSAQMQTQADFQALKDSQQLLEQRQSQGSTVGGFANDGVMNPIYAPAGTVTMGLPEFIYQQCAMSTCHGNVDLPYTHGWLSDEESREFALSASLTVGTFAASGVLTAARSLVLISDAKLGYLLGHATGRAHNIERTLQNAVQLGRVGVHDTAAGRALLQSHFEGVAASRSNILRSFTNEYGVFQVRESLFAGPGGFLKFESTWQVLPGGGSRFVTAIPFGGL